LLSRPKQKAQVASRSRISDTAGVSEARINGLALKRENSKNTFVNAAERFLPDKSFQRLDTQSELPQCQGALSRNGAASEALQIFGKQILRAVDDSQILAATALDGGLN
jgi:hypothetical protein